MTRPASDGLSLATRVAGVFGTRVLAFGFLVTASFLMARLLGPSGRGVYGTVTTFTAMLFTFAQLGLPSAITYFAGRGRSIASLRRSALLLAIGISICFVGLALLLLTPIDQTIAQTATPGELLLGLAVLPVLLASAMAGSILYGRQATRSYNLIQLGQAAGTLLAVVILVGLLGLGVLGALVGYLVMNALAAIAVVFEVLRMERRTSEPDAPPVSLRELSSYSARLYPASVTSYFNYRADVLLLNAFGAGAGPIGLYAIAVQFAELLFYVPDSIATIFYPTVAGSSRPEADRLAPAVCRLTVLLVGLLAVALIPAAGLVIVVVLPQYVGSMLPLLILLPGVISLSISKVLAGYLSGLGRPGAATAAASVAMVVNLALNVVLIPRAGIGGAAAASLISYSVHAAMMVAFAVRLSRLPVRAFLVPGQLEVRRLQETVRSLAARMRQRRSNAT